MSLCQSPALAPVLRQQAEIIIPAAREVAARSGEILIRTTEAEKGKRICNKRSWNLVENKGTGLGQTHDLVENKERPRVLPRSL